MATAELATLPLDPPLDVSVFFQVSEV